jgi:hypothetical protein
MEKLGWPWGGGGTPKQPKIQAPLPPDAGFVKRLIRNRSYLKPTKVGGVFGLIFAPGMIKQRAQQIMNPGRGN